MQKLAAVLLTLLATSAVAFQGRPVSDLRFDGRATLSSYRVASDGTDFLLLAHRYEWVQDSTFVEKVVDGKPVRFQHQLGIGPPVALAWTGAHYLAAWGDQHTGLRTASLSRDGSVISMSETAVVQGRWFRMVASSEGALAFGLTDDKITVQPLDVAGKPAGTAKTYNALSPLSVRGAAAVPGGFALAFTDFKATSVMLFRADGSAMTPTPIIVEGPYGGSPTDYHSSGAVIGTDGTDILIVFGAGTSSGDWTLKAAVISPSGVVKSVRVIHTLPGSPANLVSMRPVEVVWDGTRYVAALSVDKDPAYGDSNIDPALIPITRNGDLAGELKWVTEDQGRQYASSLGWNGRELLVPMYTSITPQVDPALCVSIDPDTLIAKSSTRFGRTLSTQWSLALHTGHGGSLAAWAEHSDGEVTIRASRLDLAGNYLDGEGLILDAWPAQAWASDELTNRSIVIDGHGPQWFVVWSDGQAVRGRSLSRQGMAGPQTLLIGSGNEAAVQWTGSQYLIVRSDKSIYSNTVTTEGIVGESKLIAEYEQTAVKGTTFYGDPLLARMGGRMLAVYKKEHYLCGFMPDSCDVKTTVTGHLLDDPAAPAFTIAETVAPVLALSLAVSPTKALVTWGGNQGHSGAFLPAEALDVAGAPFRIDAHSYLPSVGFDGQDFIGAWWQDPYGQRTLVTVKIRTDGVVHDRRTTTFDARPFWLRKPVVAAAANVPTLIGFVTQVRAHDSIPRAAMLLVSDIDGAIAPPPAPSITCATRTDDQINVRWEPVVAVLGYSIELQLPDGMFRAVEVAPSDAGAATVPSTGFAAAEVRVRAWNSAGLSQPSAIAPALPVPAADVHAMSNACAGAPVEVTASLTGTPPFIVRWSDGVMQTVSSGYTATRLLTLDRDTRISVDSVSDASCEVGTMNGGVDIHVAAAPHIDQQSRVVGVSRDQPATLNVVTATHGTRFAWYEGVRGDTAHPVGRNDATFTTPPVTRTMHYWVRLTTNCGTIDSETMTVAIDTRRRAARK